MNCSTTVRVRNPAAGRRCRAMCGQRSFLKRSRRKSPPHSRAMCAMCSNARRHATSRPPVMALTKKGQVACTCGRTGGGCGAESGSLSALAAFVAASTCATTQRVLINASRAFTAVMTSSAVTNGEAASATRRAMSAEFDKTLPRMLASMEAQEEAPEAAPAAISARTDTNTCRFLACRRRTFTDRARTVYLSGSRRNGSNVRAPSARCSTAANILAADGCACGVHMLDVGAFYSLHFTACATRLTSRCLSRMHSASMT